MHADAQAADTGVGVFLDARTECLASVPQPRQRLVAAGRCQQGERIVQLRLNAQIQLPRLFGIDQLRCEFRLVAGLGQQCVHLAQATTEHRAEFLKLGERGVATVIGRAATHQGVTNRPLQTVLGPFPGIALIAQVALGNHQQRRLAVHPDAADLTQQRCDVGKTQLAQLAGHLQFRMHARREPAQQFQHQLVGDDH